MIDQRSEFGDKTTPPSTMRYELESAFDADRDLIDLLSGLAAASAGAGVDTTFTPLPADAVDAMKGMATYAATAVFRRVERPAARAVIATPARAARRATRNTRPATSG